MSTGHPFNENLYTNMTSNNAQHLLKKGSHITKRKSARKNRSQIHFRFGGNRKDPLNLNSLIQKRKQNNADVNADSMIHSVDSINQHGNDRPVEILLQPDIFDPLRLDPSSRVDEDLNPLYSIPSTSTETQPIRNTRVYPSRTKRFLNKQQHQHAPPRYGNFQGYYGYRQPNEDQRLQYFQPDWFENKRVLDIGCHTGHVTFYIAEHFQPREILGLDIDQHLVHQAQNQLWHRIQTHQRPEIVDPYPNETKRYPFNLRFQQGNFVLENETDLTEITPEYDTIIAFSVTKWIHLNFGDQGLKRFFRRIYRTLTPGGKLLLEPQPWSSYRLKRRMTKDLMETYKQIQLKPTEFVSYLLSTDVGFETCTTIATPDNTHKGFQRSIFLFIKPSTIDS